MQQQLRSIRNRIAAGGGGGTIELNDGKVGPASDPSQPGVQEALLSAIDAVEPLARAGVVDENNVRDLLGGTVTNEIRDQREVRNATADVEVLLQLQRNGTHNDQQTLNGLQELEKVYGRAVLGRTPGYANIAGVEEQLQEARQQQLAAYAESNGWDPKYVRWDDRANRPTTDGHAVQMDSAMEMLKLRKAQTAEIPSQLAADRMKMQLNHLDAQIKTAQNFIVQQEKMGIHNANDHVRLRGLILQQWELLKGADPTALSPDPNAFSTPAESSKSGSSFNSTTDLESAIRSGELTPGSSFILNGQSGVVGADGRPKRR
jgi:hypothetical protein